MGKISQGILGGFSGKVGPIVGCRWKSIFYIRSRAARVSNPNTLLQQCQRGKFRSTVNFLKTILSFVQVGFGNCDHNKSAYNAAVSYQMRYAFAGEGASARLDFRKVRVSMGSLTPASGASVRVSRGGATFTWADNTGEGDADGTDTAMLLVYNKLRGQSCFLLSAASRSQRSGFLRLPQGWESEELAVYLAFRSADGERVSNSVCLYDGIPQQYEDAEEDSVEYMVPAVRAVLQGGKSLCGPTSSVFVSQSRAKRGVSAFLIPFSPSYAFSSPPINIYNNVSPHPRLFLSSERHVIKHTYKSAI